MALHIREAEIQKEHINRANGIYQYEFLLSTQKAQFYQTFSNFRREAN